MREIKEISISDVVIPPSPDFTWFEGVVVSVDTETVDVCVSYYDGHVDIITLETKKIIARGD